MRKASVWRSLAVFGIAAICAVALNTVTRAQTDPFAGTWKLDVAKSTYKPGPAPKSASVAIEPVGKGLKVAVESVTADGPMKWGYTNAGDGKESPVTGNPAYDTVVVTRTTPAESTVVYKKAGKTVVTLKASVAKDGKTMTTTAEGTDAKGQAMHNVAVYTKQ